MPDPMSNDEVEDILSSIRRLVSDEKKPVKSVQSAAAAPVDRLVLTPALRVSDEAQVTEGDASIADDAAGDRAGDALGQADVSDRIVGEAPGAPRSDDSDDPLTLAPEHAVPDGAGDASAALDRTDETQAALADWSDSDEGIWDTETGPDNDETGAGFDDEAPFAEDVDADDWSAFDEDRPTGSVTRLSEDEVPFDDDVLEAEEVFDDDASGEAEDEDTAQNANGDVLDFVPAQNDVGADDDGPHLEADPVTEMTADDAYLVFQHHGATTADAMIEAETEDDARDDTKDGAGGAAISAAIDISGGSDLAEKVAALETLMARRQARDDWEPDGAGEGEYAGTAAPSIAWEDTVPDLEHVPSDANVAPDGAGGGASLDLGHSEDAFLDETVLRELISDIVREELQGAMGERITRNVRKLVRREIHRALAAQDLD